MTVTSCRDLYISNVLCNEGWGEEIYGAIEALGVAYSEPDADKLGCVGIDMTREMEMVNGDKNCTILTAERRKERNKGLKLVSAFIELRRFCFCFKEEVCALHGH